MQYKTVVIDIGTGYTKLGYADNFEPNYIIPSTIADSYTNVNVIVSKPDYIEQLDFYVGDEAINHAQTHNLQKFMRSGQIDDWNLVEKFLHKCIYQYIRCDPSETYFILTEPPMNTPENREQLAEIMFETFNCAGLFIGVQAVMALYAGVFAKATKSQEELRSSDLTGTVIDIGDGVTHIVPVSDSYVISSCIKHIPLAGSNITSFIQNMMYERGDKIPSEDRNLIAQKIKEKFGYVAEDPFLEFTKYDQKVKTDKELQQSEMFVYSKFKGPITKQECDVRIGYERFLGPEMFFHPEFMSNEYREPIDLLVDQAIQNSPIDIRRNLYKNIVLSGGSTLIKGFSERLHKEVKRRVDNRINSYRALAKSGVSVPDIEVNVVRNMVQKYAVWFGGSFIASSPTFQRVIHKREEYEREGPSIARHNPVFPKGM